MNTRYDTRDIENETPSMRCQNRRHDTEMKPCRTAVCRNIKCIRFVRTLQLPASRYQLFAIRSRWRDGMEPGAAREGADPKQRAELQQGKGELKQL